MTFPIAHWPDAHFPNAHWPHEAVPVPPAPTPTASPSGQLGDPLPRRREHWPKQGIGYEEEYRLLQEAKAAEAERAAKAAKVIAKIEEPVEVSVRLPSEAEREAAYSQALEDEKIKQAIAELLQEDEDAMSLIAGIL